jgi:DNA-binding MarR family transcriptional regulator/N-acetylglutamate synthase-like GNAT family acetyltransferase
MRLFEQLGRVAIGTRVRFFGERITEDAAQIYALYGIEMNPKWFPVFFALSERGEKTITSIAKEIGHSHVSVSKIVGEMSRAHLVSEKISTEDRRRTMVSLTKLGKEITKKIESQYLDVRAAVEELSSQSTHDLWKALEEWEQLLTEKSLLKRVIEQKKRRESADVEIVPYSSKYHSAFRELNLEWIKTYFKKVEKADRDALDHPKEYILDRGGFIYVAKVGGSPVGVCALLKRNDPDYPFELAKMAVAPAARGKSIGWLLGKAIIEKAKSLDAERVYLESNTKLRPAIGLYKKLGFGEIIGPPTPYQRCNIQMELRL